MYQVFVAFSMVLANFFNFISKSVNLSSISKFSLVSTLSKFFVTASGETSAALAAFGLSGVGLNWAGNSPDKPMSFVSSLINATNRWR